MSKDTKPTEYVDSPVAAVVFTPVAFVPHDPERWFAILEHQFRTRRITNQYHKFTYALESMPSDIGASVRDLIISPPDDNPYDCLKEAVLRQCLPSTEERLRQLLARQPIGDTKPSRHLAHLRSLAGPQFKDSDIVRELWVRALPRHIQITVTALLEDTTLDKAAQVADKIVARVGSEEGLLVATTHRPYRVDMDESPVRSDRPRPRRVQERLSFQDRIAQPEPVTCRPSQARSTYPKRRQSQARPNEPPPARAPQQGYCWFHRQYGDNARRCRPPCSYGSGKAQAGE